ncbi:MAG: hypothetical protein KUG71_02755, partial [Porticoccaceae bacterium]|nr:hypothetical protein [Porticoccaceae bacterium]
MLGINQDLRSVALFGVISALVIWLLSSFNVFDSLNTRLYELSSPVFFDAPEPQVVSLAVDQQHMANEVEFSKLIAKLQAFSPGRLLLLTDGFNLPPNFDVSMAGLAIVPLLQHSTDYMGDKRLSLTRQLAKFPPGQVAIPSLGQGGMLRSAIFNYRDPNGQSFSSFLLDFESPASNKSEFLINFDKMPVYIPEITSEQVLQDKIIAQLVRGKLVLMGSGYIASQSILERPGADDNMGITVL